MSQLTLDQARLQAIMDVIGNTPGSILVRGPDRWIALQPGNVGDVLVIGAGGMPEWTDPQNVNFG
jgi:hypothetical protein